MASFKELMKKRKAVVDDAYANSSPYESYDKKTKDPRIVTFGLTEDGKENNIIGRFIPSKKFLEGKDDRLWVNKFTHSYKYGTAQLYFNCLNSLGKPCPQCLRFKDKFDWSDKEAMKAHSYMFPDRRYLANFLIIDDEGNPERNGTVVVIRFNHSIMKKILEKKESGVDPFDIIEGTNFHMYITKSAMKGDGGEFLPQFNACRFVNQQTELAEGNEKKIEKIINSTIDLSEFIVESDYMSYDELEKYITKKTGTSLEESDEKANTDDDEKKSDGKDIVDEEVEYEDMDLDELKAYAIDNDMLTQKQIDKLVGDLKASNAKAKLIEKLEELDAEAEGDNDEGKEAEGDDGEEEKKEEVDLDEMDLDDLKEFAIENDYFTAKQIAKQLEGLKPNKAQAKLLELIKEEMGEPEDGEGEDAGEADDNKKEDKIPDFDEMELDDIIEYAVEKEIFTKKQIDKKLEDMNPKKAKNKLISLIEDALDGGE